MSETRNANANANLRKFDYFRDLNEDLMVNILAFVADAPMEFPHANPRSSLTGIIPFVSKKFHHFSQSDYFWCAALKRLVLADPFLWEEGLLRLLPKGTKSSPRLIEESKERLSMSYMSLFRSVYQHYLQFTGPVFHMNGRVRLGQPFGLHFFEPRYRFLIREVMDEWPDSAKQGELVIANENGQFPTFIYAHKSPLAPTSPACLVQVRRCTIHGDGSADVILIPVAYVWLRDLWERPGTGRLYYARCLRMGREQTRQMEETEENVEHDLMQLLEQNGGLDNPSTGAMHAILSYLLSGRVRVEERGEENDMNSDDEEAENDDEGNDNLDQQGDDQYRREF